MKRKTLLTLGWTAAVLLLFTGAGKGTAERLTAGLTEGVQAVMHSIVIPYGLILPLCMLLLHPLEKIPFTVKKPYTAKKWVKRAVLQTGIAMPVLQLSNLLLLFCKDTPPAAGFAEKAAENLPFYLFLLLLFNPVAEEFAFRKVFLERLRPLGERAALFFSAVFFALPHLFSQGFPQMLYTFVLGLFWGDTVLQTGRLRESVLLHAFSNLYGFFLPLILCRTPAGTAVFMLLTVGMAAGAFGMTGKALAEKKKRSRKESLSPAER